MPGDDKNPVGDELSRDLRSGPRTPPVTRCLTPAQFAELASGAETGDSDAMLEHIAQCDDCGAIFAATNTQEDADDPSVPEWIYSPRLRPERPPDWMGQTKRSIISRLIRPKTLAAVVALATVALAIFVVPRLGRAHSAEKLLAAAYAEQRPMEMRLPGVAYGPVRQVRAGEVQRTAALVRAEAIVAEELESAPASSKWLDLKARVALLNWDSRTALALLRDAAGDPHRAVDVDLDLGVAYWQESKRTDDPALAARAIEVLSSVLKRKPDWPVALFNRALAYETIEARTQAAADWERYLAIDPTGPWAAEAREKLKRLRGSSLGPSSGQVNGRPTGLGEPVEGLLDIAVRRWLPEVSCPASQSASTRADIASLARRLERENGDVWLRDAAREARPALCAAVRAVASAVQSSSEGDADAARALAHDAAVVLPASAPALRLRANLEEAYASIRLSAPPACAAIAELQSQASARGYRAIAAQAALERGICLNLGMQVAAGRTSIASGLWMATAAGFDTLRLRAMGILAAAAAGSGDIARAWKLQVEGLRLFWSASYPAMRAYQFYTEMGSLAETLGQRFLAAALAREAATAADQTGNRPTQALAHFVLASNLAEVASPEQAGREFRTARLMFDALPRTPGYRAYSAYAELNRVDLAGAETNMQDAVRALDALRPVVQELDNAPLAFRFFAVSGAARMRGRRYDEAGRDLEAALGYARQGLAAMSSNSRDADLWREQVIPIRRRLAELRLLSGDDPRRALAQWIDRGFPPAVPPGDLVLVYMARNTGLALWAASGSGIQYHAIPATTATLDNLVDDFTRLARSPGTSPARFDAARSDLRKLVFAPAERAIRHAKSITLLLDGALRRAPMAALLDGWTDAPARVALRWESPPRAEPPSALGSALVVESPFVRARDSFALPPLADVAAEVAAVRSAFPSAVVLNGREATLPAVLGSLPDAGLFHYAGHGVLNRSGAGLVLSPESDDEDYAVLDATRLPGMLGRCRVAVLSACSSAEESPETTVDSLPSAFLRAGARTVVASRWAVDSRASALLMEGFYGALRAGSEACTALYSAEAALRRNPSYERPYYWAAYECYVGD